MVMVVIILYHSEVHGQGSYSLYHSKIIMHRMAQLSGADDAGVFSIFKYCTHTLHKVKHWRNPLISLAPLYQMCLLAIACPSIYTHTNP